MCYVVSTDVFNKILLDGWNELRLRVYGVITVEKRVEKMRERLNRYNTGSRTDRGLPLGAVAVCLPVRETRVRSLVREDPTCG